MEKQKISIIENSVQETLLIPLYARALESKRDDNIISDPESEKIFERINYDFSIIEKDWATISGLIIRTEIVDKLASDFISRNPNAIIVNLGAGLCTRFFRLDNGKLTWFELDLPEVIDFKRQFAEENGRYSFIQKSVFDYSWIEDIKMKIGKNNISEIPFLFIAEGLFVYLKKSEVKRFFKTIAEIFSHSEIIFEATTPFFSKISHYHRGAVRCMKVRFDWGVYFLKSLKTIHPKLEYLGKYYYYNKHPERWRYLRFFKYIPGLQSILRIGHYKIN